MNTQQSARAISRQPPAVSREPSAGNRSRPDRIVVTLTQCPLTPYLGMTTNVPPSLRPPNDGLYISSA